MRLKSVWILLLIAVVLVRPCGRKQDKGVVAVGYMTKHSRRSALDDYGQPK